MPTNIFIQTFDFLKKYWVQLTVIVSVIGAFSILPYRLGRAETDIKDLKAQTTAVYAWVSQEQSNKAHEKELQASAPPGYRWDSNTRTYVKK